MRQNSAEAIVPDLATSWTWSEDGKNLTFQLRKGVTWNDGKPFTAADVKCTWDLLTNKGPDTFRINSRAGWYVNVESVGVTGEQEAVFNLKAPQPALLSLLEPGFTPVYPCHVSPAQMRQAPIGTGPVKFVGFQKNQGIKVVRNPNHWKPGRPYLDGIEYTIIPNRSTAILAFVSGQFDMFFPYELTVPLVADVKAQMPNAVCDISPMNVAPNILMNPAPPFDNLDVRRAVAMALDRKAFIDIFLPQPCTHSSPVGFSAALRLGGSVTAAASVDWLSASCGDSFASAVLLANQSAPGCNWPARA